MDELAQAVRERAGHACEYCLLPEQDHPGEFFVEAIAFEIEHIIPRQHRERCASCHGEKGEDPKYILLVGGARTLPADRARLTIGNFWQYATTLWSYIRRAQPFDEPGSLTPDQVYAVTAYLLYLNGIIGEQDVMDAQTLPLVKMPNRDGFVPDPRPDVGPAVQQPKR